MGIAEDIQSFKNSWSNISFSSRVIFCISIFLSFLSISSIADGVYEFKGFIVEAIRFWDVITAPAISIVEKVVPNIKPWQFDFWAIFLLALTPYVSASWGVISNRKRAFYIICMLSYPWIPFLYSQKISITLISVIYVGVMVGALMPPLNQRFLTVVLRMAIPPILVAVLAGIAEGVSRPLT